MCKSSYHQSTLSIFHLRHSFRQIRYKSGMSLRFSELDLPQKNIFPIPARSKLSQKQNHTNNQWLICHNDTIPLKRKNNMCLDKFIFFLDQELNESSVVINIGGVYEDNALFFKNICQSLWYVKMVA